jgi:hydrogenase-4 component F
MIWALLLTPGIAGLLAFVVPWHGVRRAWLVATALTHAGLTATAWLRMPEPVGGGWLGMDAAAVLFLGIVSALFLVVSVYAVGYLRQEERLKTHADFEEGPLFTNSPEANFTGCLLLFLATMTLVLVSRHWGLMWVAVEATTLASAPLIYFHRHHRSLEATWKYLLICSVGIALALLGNFFLAVASHTSGGEPLRLTVDELQQQATRLDPRWLNAAFILILVGYGTKMGLAPLHTWLPDAHSEAPSLVSALLSGALLNCALLPILRLHGVLVAAGQAAFSQELLIFFGLLSMGVAAIFIIGQTDFKRLLAYSSVEHMGVLVFGVGVGGIAGFGTMLHALNHSLTKGMLFLAAGNLLAAYRTKSTTGTGRVLRVLPGTGLLWVAGFLAICGSPPFGPFISELTILQGAMAGGHLLAAVGYLAALAVIFVGMATIVLRMAYGEPAAAPGSTAPAPPTVPVREPLWSIAPPAALGLIVLVLGVYVPPGLADLLHRAAEVIGAP